MDKYPNNSFKARDRESKPPAERHMEKIVTGGVKKAKKSGFRRFIGLFVSEDIDNLPMYILKNVILPNLKRTFLDSAEIALNGDTGKRRTSGSSIVSEYRGGNTSQSRTRYDVQNLYEIDDIILDTYGDCEAVLDEMSAAIEQFGLVSVNDLYDMLGIQSTRNTDCKYGWTSIRTAKIVPVRGGAFMLKLPRVVPLN